PLPTRRSSDLSTPNPGGRWSAGSRPRRVRPIQRRGHFCPMRLPKGRQTEVVPREFLVLCAGIGAEGDFIFGPSEEMTGGTVMVKIGRASCRERVEARVGAGAGRERRWSRGTAQHEAVEWC